MNKLRFINVPTGLTAVSGVLAAALCGCHQPEGELFPALPQAVVYPPAPERPRIELLGTLSDSGDLKAARGRVEVLKAALRGPRPAVPLVGPNGIAVHGRGKLAISDSPAGAVHILDLQRRTHVRSLGSQERPFGCPIGVAWIGDRLFAADAQHGEIAELDAQGRVHRRFGGGELVRPVGLAALPEHRRLVVVDGGAHVLQVYDLAGNMINTLGRRGAAPGEFNYPTHVGYDGAGTLAVADTGNFRVQLLDLEGECLKLFGRKGDAAGDLALPKGVAFDSAGHLYVVDAQFENFQIFDREGRLLLAVGQEGAAPGRFSLPAGIAIDTRDRVWIADTANGRVQAFQYLHQPDQEQLAQNPQVDTVP